MTTAVSLFAGIGGFDLALEREGVRVTAAAEIDKDCRGVLARHFPEATLFSDVQEITGADLIATGFEPETGILTAGWPCQGNSVAGRRKGMADARSGLWWDVVRLLAETRPRYFIGENVPGLLTVNGGRDFLAVIKSLDELGYGYCWRVLDAQYLGVPQRRKRVILVGCLGDGSRPSEILLEPESRHRDSAPGPQAGARVAGTLAASAGSGGLGGVGQSANAITSRIVEVASTLQGGGRRGYRIDAEGAAGGHVIPVAMRGREGGNQIEYGDPGEPAYGVRTGGGGSSYPMVAHPVAYSIQGANSNAKQNHAIETETARCLDTSGASGNQGGMVVLDEVAHTLTSGVATKPGVNPPGRRSEDDYNLVCVTGDVTHTLRSEGADASEDGTGRGTPIVTVANAITSHHHRYDREETWIPSRWGVRRLTPRECERLQGFPDDWTAGQSDSARYRQLGNAVAVPVIAWVARRALRIQSQETSNHPRKAA